MTRIRIVRNWQWPNLLQQTPGRSGIWDGVRFVEGGNDGCDLCVVLNNLAEGEAPPGPAWKVWRVVQEPPVEFFEPWHKNPDYASLTLTCDPARNGQEYLRSHPMVPWHVNRDYDFLMQAAVPQKTAVLSWITSTKAILAGHRSRMNFLPLAVNGVPELALLGTRVHHIVKPEARRKNEEEQRQLGFSVVEDKWAGLAPYRYSLAIENFSGPDYWTEKLADCFLAWSLPIYHGCTNLEDYFPAESFIRIDINKPGEALETIQRALRDDPWEKRLPALAEARRLVLQTYQLFPSLVRTLQSTPPLRPAMALTGGSPVLGKPLLSVVVCTYNRQEMLRDCLQALAEQTLGADLYEVLIVDNNSSDQTQHVCAEFSETHAHFRCHFEPQQGLSHARNRGWQQAQADYVAFIDDDSIADRNWLAEALTIITEKAPAIFGGAVYSRLTGDEPQWFRSAYATRGDMGESGWLDEGWIIGTNIFFRKSLLAEYGGFDPQLGMQGDRLGYHEETQLVFRALAEQKGVYFSRDLIVRDILLDYKKSLAYFLFAKFRAGADGLSLWKPTTSQRKLEDLPALLEKAMEELHTALLRRDREKYPYPENYLLETGAADQFFELGRLCAFFKSGTR